jgi:hypothetical protein
LISFWQYKLNSAAGASSNTMYKYFFIIKQVEKVKKFVSLKLIYSSLLFFTFRLTLSSVWQTIAAAISSPVTGD